MTEQNIHLLWDSEIDHLIVTGLFETLSQIENLDKVYPNATVEEIINAVRQDILDNGPNSKNPIVISKEELPAFLADEDNETEDASLETDFFAFDDLDEEKSDEDASVASQVELDADWDEALADDAQWVAERQDEAIRLQAESDAEQEATAIEQANHDANIQAQKDLEELEADWDAALEDDALWVAEKQDEANKLQAEKDAEQARIAQAEKDLEELEADWDEALEDDAEWNRIREEEKVREAAYEAYENAVNAKASSNLSNTRKAMLKHLSSINDDNSQ